MHRLHSRRPERCRSPADTSSLAGIAAGLLAAVPGSSTMSTRCLPAVRQRRARRGMRSATSVALVLFAARLLLTRRADWTASIGHARARDCRARRAGLCGMAGWHARHPQLDQRRPSLCRRGTMAGGAASRSTRAKPLAVGQADDLKDGHMKLLHINGQRSRSREHPSGFARVRRWLHASRRIARRRRAHRRNGAVSLARLAVRLRDRHRQRAVPRRPRSACTR